MENLLPKKIRKRDSSMVSFNSKKIENAIFRAALETLQDEPEAKNVSLRTTQKLLPFWRCSLVVNKESNELDRLANHLVRRKYV